MKKHSGARVSLKRKIQFAALLIFTIFAGAAFFLEPFSTRAETDRQSAENFAGTENSAGAENLLPEIQEPLHDKIGLGQRLFFGIEVIDEEGDFVKIELIEKPKSAKFIQNTLTVDWTPQTSDGEIGKFKVRVTEIPRDKNRKTRFVTKDFSIRVVKEKVPLKKLPPTSLEVDAFVSVIDPERLEAANEKWDIVSLFQRIGEIEADKQKIRENGIKPATGAELFRDALKELAIMHKNPTLDPDSPNFNEEWNAEHWHLTAVRPRINKKVFELRLVYFNEKAPEQSYLMPRLRIVRGDDASRPEDLRQKNNFVFAEKFHEMFFDGAEMKDFVARDKKKYGRALADFITWVLTYEDPKEPMMKANFAALPHNSRLGGGNEYDEKGNYLHGDGWALGAFLVKPVAQPNGGKRLAFVSPPISGFVASIQPNEEETAFKPAAPPVADPSSPKYKKGWEKLIGDDGTVLIPEVLPDGTVRGSNIDTTINAYEYKFGYQTAETALDDPRRRLFEEKGMTCIQCHVRNFDEGDYLVSVQKPSDVKSKEVSARRIPRVFFVIIPTLHGGRNEYIHREEQEQVGNLKGVFRDYLGINVRMNSPLALEWVHGTKKGRS